MHTTSPILPGLTLTGRVRRIEALAAAPRLAGA